MKENINQNKEKYYDKLVILSGILLLGVVLPLVVGLITNSPLSLILENVFFFNHQYHLHFG